VSPEIETSSFLHPFRRGTTRLRAVSSSANISSTSKASSGRFFGDDGGAAAASDGAADKGPLPPDEAATGAFLKRACEALRSHAILERALQQARGRA